MGRLRRLLARRPSSSIRRQRRRANHGGGRPSEARGAVGRRGCGQAAAMALGTGPPPLSRPRGPRGGGGPPPPTGAPGPGGPRRGPPRGRGRESRASRFGSDVMPCLFAAHSRRCGCPLGQESHSVLHSAPLAARAQEPRTRGRVSPSREGPPRRRGALFGTAERGSAAARLPADHLERLQACSLQVGAGCPQRQNEAARGKRSAAGVADRLCANLSGRAQRRCRCRRRRAVPRCPGGDAPAPEARRRRRAHCSVQLGRPSVAAPWLQPLARARFRHRRASWPRTPARAPRRVVCRGPRLRRHKIHPFKLRRAAVPAAQHGAGAAAVCGA
jgi:hypothetical protein